MAARAALAEWQSRSDALKGATISRRPSARSACCEAERELANAVRSLRRSTRKPRTRARVWRIGVGRRAGERQRRAQAAEPGRTDAVLPNRREGSWLIEIPEAPGPLSARRLVVELAAGRALGIAQGPLTRAKLERVLDGPAGLLADIERPPVPGFPDETSLTLAALFDVLVPRDSKETLRSASGTIVIPDGPLARLPFEALVVGFPRKGVAPSYWIDDGPPVRYTVSATLLTALSRNGPAPASGGLLCVADPDYGPSQTSRWARAPWDRARERRRHRRL